MLSDRVSWNFAQLRGKVKTQSLVSNDLEVDYGSEEIASMVYAALAVDKEVVLHESQAFIWNMHFEAVEPRFLRASYSAFVDVLTLATKTIEEFGKGIAL
ncbi:hypothetical protein FEM48_Zijuj03G0178900 [Ziziphus jujuba var. spinosa]|uniref:Uncharacterized protein n=1 Tax=Ziziphus jujuba var. spinosa TaxID=714518 RepID=A0A978VRS1_ZIZJJ|nr:hypothetical protein FEM48_Zijuj03G0178900 [Ziziphus jujuba var. spinosa]